MTVTPLQDYKFLNKGWIKPWNQPRSQSAFLALPTFEGKSALRTWDTNQSTHAGIKCLAFLTLAMEQRANTSFSAYLAHRAYWKKLSLRYVWWPRTANRKIRILKEYEFKTLFNVHLHRSFKKVIFLSRWKPIIRHLRASSIERVVNTTKSMWCTHACWWCQPSAGSKILFDFNFDLISFYFGFISFYFDLTWFYFHFSFELK